VKGGRIGVDRAGYREDWAVIELDPLYNGENCIWWEDPDHLSRFVGKESFQAGRLVGCKDPAADGTEWYQEGATDSWEGGGGISKTDLELFMNGTTDVIEARFNIFSSQLESLKPQFGVYFYEYPWSPMANKGDSGAGLYAIEGENNLVFGGLVVSLFVPRDARMGPPMVMVVPQSRLFAQVKAETGLEWKLVGA
jgi:hypothetical protein